MTVLRLAKRVVPPSYSGHGRRDAATMPRALARRSDRGPLSICAKTFRAGVARLASGGAVLVRDGELMVGNRMLLDAVPEPVWRI